MTEEWASRPQLPVLRAIRQADERHCYSCARLIHASAAACPACGAAQGAVAGPVQAPALEAGQGMFCYGCGNKIHVTAPICPACGAPQQGLTRSSDVKDRTTAIVLAFLLGGIGAHKFYLGQPGWGVVYLLFCWTFIPALAAMIEGLIYIAITDQEFGRRYSAQQPRYIR